VTPEIRKHVFELYEKEDVAVYSGGDWLYKLIAALSLALFGAAGLYLYKHNPPPGLMEEKAAHIRQVSFLIEEQKKSKPAPAKPVAEKKEAPKPVEKKAPAKNEPIDLTKKPELNQKVDDVKPENPPVTNAPPVRRVYGLRKVYSTGIGAGGAASDAVIGKLGNTLAAPIDTFVASKAEVKGAVAPVTTIQTMPKRKNSPMPEYTKEMRENRIQGVVRVNLLIDIDGRVKKAVVLDDLGYGSKEKVFEACLKLEFEPAMRNGEPVAVWYPFSFRFELVQ
jgi:TonB family protein